MKNILAFGDSNTWGFVPGTKTMERYSEDIRWTGVLQDKCDNAHILEEGLCGRTTAFDDPLLEGRNGLKALPEILDRNKFDAIIIMLGTNDCKSALGLSATDIRKGAELCLNEIEKSILPSNILLVSPIELEPDVWHNDKDPAFNTESVTVCRQLKEEYSSLAKEHSVAFLAASDYAKANYADCEHLDNVGHHNLAEAIYDNLKVIGII